MKTLILKFSYRLVKDPGLSKGLVTHISTMAQSQIAKKSFTAGIIVIGDEILKGRTTDTNSAFLTKKLYNLGVKVRKISVIPDDSEVISREVCVFIISVSQNHIYYISHAFFNLWLT